MIKLKLLEIDKKLIVVEIQGNTLIINIKNLIQIILKFNKMMIIIMD